MSPPFCRCEQPGRRWISPYPSLRGPTGRTDKRMPPAAPRWLRTVSQSWRRIRSFQVEEGEPDNTAAGRTEAERRQAVERERPEGAAGPAGGGFGKRGKHTQSVEDKAFYKIYETL